MPEPMVTILKNHICLTEVFFEQIRIPNNIRIFKNDEYEYYSEFEKLFKYYSWEIFE